MSGFVAQKKIAPGGIHQTEGGRFDTNLDDDPAGIARKRLAAESKARYAREAAELAKQNSAYHNRVAKTGTRTDDDIMDEAAGQYRLQLAADSKERKANEKADLARKNAEMRDMITNTPPAYLDHAGASTGIYATYNTHLQDKIGGSPARSNSPPPS